MYNDIIYITLLYKYIMNNSKWHNKLVINIMILSLV